MKFKQMNIKKRLTTGFYLVVGVMGIAALVTLISMVIISSQYDKILTNYAFPQGDIGKAMTALADVRSATRAVIGYDSEEEVQKVLKAHDEKITELYSYLPAIEATMVTPEGKASFADISKKLETYMALDKEVVELGKSLDPEASHQAQLKAFNELSPAYAEVEKAVSDLMNINIQKGDSAKSAITMVQIIIFAVVIVVIICMVIFSTRFGLAIANGISVPVSALSERLKKLADGDLHSDFPEMERKDEIAEMTDEAHRMAAHLNEVFGDVGELMGMMANGNFNIHPKHEAWYVGDYYALYDAMKKLNHQMNDTLQSVAETAAQVSAGASNMADAAQALAEGATDQAASVEEMQATLDNITEGVGLASSQAQNNYEQAHAYAKEAQNSQAEMKNMMEAMNRINDAAQKIANIISEIEDIASQTNLLSLNASIEAARAGEAGKGFAVVADQIGKLAAESAQSAVNTRDLIEGAIHEVEIGNKTAELVSASLGEVVQGVQMLAESSKTLSQSANGQAEAMKQADAGINRISEVVQSNSATAEESSATSEELAAQASTLDELVSQFQLRV